MSDIQAPSIDPREQAQFGALAERWWDVQGPFWPLHRLNGVRVDWLAEQVCVALGRDPRRERPLAGLRLLDIGCGGGILSEAMARLGAAVTGIDVVERNIGIARTHAAGEGLDIDYRLTSVEALAAGAGRFDIVLNMEVVEHVADFDGFMTAAAALVDHGGVMAVATLNRTALAWITAIVGAEYLLRWLPRGTHRWGRFRTPGEVEALLAASGLGVSARSGVGVDPLHRRIYLRRSEAVNYMLLAGRKRD